MAQPMKIVTQFSLAAPFSSEYSLQPMTAGHSFHWLRHFQVNIA